MELEVEMYVRTKWGIGKYIEDYTNSQNLTWRVLQGCSNYNNQEDWQNLFCDSEILKASHLLLGDDKEDGVIEVGDYVNGVLITDISEDNKGKYVFGYSKDGFEGEIWFYNNEIKSIVTKEQFEAMQYEIK